MLPNHEATCWPHVQYGLIFMAYRGAWVPTCGAGDHQARDVVAAGTLPLTPPAVRLRAPRPAQPHVPCPLVVR